MNQQENNSDHSKQFKINAAIERLIACYDTGGKLMICGNGGSAANAIHIANDFIYGFDLNDSSLLKEKKTLRSIITDKQND